MIISDRTILVDVDSVLLDWLSGFHSWMATTGFVDTFLTEPPRDQMVDPYALHTQYGLPDNMIFTLIKMFNSSVHIGELSPMHGARGPVRYLVDEGFHFHALTSFSDNLSAFEMRKQNLKAVFGEGAFSGFTFLPLRASKAEVLNTIAKSHIVKPLVWIDDLPHHALAGANAGIPSINFDPYGIHKDQEGITRLTNWNRIVNYIEERYDY